MALRTARTHEKTRGIARAKAKIETRALSQHSLMSLWIIPRRE